MADHSHHMGHDMNHGGQGMEQHAHHHGSVNEAPPMLGHTGMSMPHTITSHMMSMSFHGGYNETILFEQWRTDSVGAFVGSFFAIFIMALVYEGLKYYRKHLLWKTYERLQYCAVAPNKITQPEEPHIIQPGMVERKTPTMLSASHAWQTVLHGAQVLVSYALMLIFMTYNTWLCLAVVLGSATGYFLFGWRESVVVDFTEHCH